MEQLIIFIVMLALGSLFGKKKEQPKKTPTVEKPIHNQQRPIHTQTKHIETERTNAAPANKPRSLKDLSRNLFDEIQKEFKELQPENVEPEPQQKKSTPQTEVFYPEPSSPARSQLRPERAEHVSRMERMEHIGRAERIGTEQQTQKSEGRLRSERSASPVENSRILQEDLIPKTSKQILQGIVYAEILGPPKSKR